MIRNKVIATILWLLSKLLKLTYRYKYINENNINDAIKFSNGKGHILALWHQNLFNTLLANTHLRHAAIISPSKDGDLLAYTVEKLGNHTVRGSSSRGGISALIELKKQIESGMPVSITVDGPRGPSKEVKQGIIALTKSTECFILPLVCIPEKFWTLNSWDKFRVGKPFSKAIVNYGEPFSIPKSITKDQFENYKKEIQKKLDECAEEAILNLPKWNQLKKGRKYKYEG